MMTDKHVDTDCVAGVHGSCLHPEHRHQGKSLMPERGYDDTSLQNRLARRQAGRDPATATVASFTNEPSL